eukprot:jgi/Psemu1/192269/e_gw1.125.20.1
MEIDGSGNGGNGNGDGDSDGNGNGDDPSKKNKKIKKPSTFALVVTNSIWMIRTVNGKFWNTLIFVVVNGTILFRETAAMIMNGVAFAYSAGVELLLTSRSEFKNQWLPLVEELSLFLTTTGIADELEKGANYRFLSNVAILARIQDTLLERCGAAGNPSHFDRRFMASFDTPTTAATTTTTTTTTTITTTTTMRKQKPVLSERQKNRSWTMDDVS